MVDFNKIPVYRFPKNKDGRKQWIKSVPNANLNATNNKKDFVCPIVTFFDENILTVQSSKFVDVIPLFMSRIYNNLGFETFHYGVKCYISSLSKNRINTVDTRSKFQEIIQYLNLITRKISWVNNFNTSQKGCIILHDEVYIKRNVTISWQTTVW